MPAYPWMYERSIDLNTTAAKIAALRTVGVPYEEGYEDVANDELKAQAAVIVESLKKDKIDADPDKEIIALIAYLQRLGTDIKQMDPSATASK